MNSLGVLLVIVLLIVYIQGIAMISENQPDKSNSKQKFRPSLSASCIQYLVNLLIHTPDNTEERKEALTKLKPFLAKIEVGGIIPAYSVSTISQKEKNKANLLESLGGTEVNSAVDQLADLQRRTTREYWKACYNKWLSDPNSLTAHEKHCADEYRYLEGLMTPEEIAEFESKPIADEHGHEYD